MERPELTDAILGAAVEVHKVLGVGFLEGVYENALVLEFEHRGIPFERQHRVSIEYRNEKVGEHRLDLLVFDEVVVELKAVSELLEVHRATLRSYLRATRKRIGLLLNFGAHPLQINRITPRHP